MMVCYIDANTSAHREPPLMFHLDYSSCSYSRDTYTETNTQLSSSTIYISLNSHPTFIFIYNNTYVCSQKQMYFVHSLSYREDQRLIQRITNE